MIQFVQLSILKDMERQLLSLCFTTLVCMMLLIFRVYYSADTSHNYLLLNLVLAWLPYIFSLVLLLYTRNKKTNNLFALAGGILWLLFFPNAPYIITDFIHLEPRFPVPLWFDAMLLSAFAFHGVVLGVASLQVVCGIVEKKFGKILTTWFLFTVVVLTSIGIYVGRMLRWNSWDVFFNPTGIVSHIVRQNFHPLEHTRAVIFIVCFTLFFLASYAFFSPILLTSKTGKKK